MAGITFCHVCYENEIVRFFDVENLLLTAEVEQTTVTVPCVSEARPEMLNNFPNYDGKKPILCRELGKRKNDVLSWVVFGILCAIIVLLAIIFYLWAK